LFFEEGEDACVRKVGAATKSVDDILKVNL
jgi:hypothetical protein